MIFIRKHLKLLKHICIENKIKSDHYSLIYQNHTRSLLSTTSSPYSFCFVFFCFFHKILAFCRPDLQLNLSHCLCLIFFDQYDYESSQRPDLSYNKSHLIFTSALSLFVKPYTRIFTVFALFHSLQFLLVVLFLGVIFLYNVYLEFYYLVLIVTTAFPIVVPTFHKFCTHLSCSLHVL